MEWREMMRRKIHMKSENMTALLAGNVGKGGERRGGKRK